MPIYSFINKKTKKEFEKEMPYSELEQYLKDNPKLQQTFRMNIGDSVRLGVTRPPSHFQRNVIERIKKTHPHNTMNNLKFASNISEI